MFTGSCLKNCLMKTFPLKLNMHVYANRNSNGIDMGIEPMDYSETGLY